MESDYAPWGEEKFMHTLTQHFDELLKRIQPPAERRAAAQEIQEDVRAFLKEREDFPTLPPHSRLVGSYARHTTTGDIKDVDFVVFYAGSVEEDAKATISKLCGVLNEFPGFLKGHGSTEASESRRSVHVYFEDRDFHLDVVPAIAPDGPTNPLFVPDREQKVWIPSDPVGYVEFLAEFNEQHHRKVRPLVRLVKHWRDQHMSARAPKSYWLEAIAVKLIADGAVGTAQPIAVVFRDLLLGVEQRFAAVLAREGATPNVPDPMLGNNVAPNWERPHFELFMRRTKDASSKALAALDTDDREEAVRLWQGLFGVEHFPSDVEQPARELAREVTPGKAFVSGAGIVTATKPASRATPTRPTRFYGDTRP